MRITEPIFYCYIREMFDRNSDVGIKTISYNRARKVLGRFNIPKRIHMFMIKEMISFGMLERINQRAIEIKWRRLPKGKAQILTNL